MLVVVPYWKLLRKYWKQDRATLAVVPNNHVDTRNYEFREYINEIK